MPATDGTELPPDQLFLKFRPLIDELIRFACCRFHLSPEDAQDFGQKVRLKLVQEDFRVLRDWKRNCSLRRYLATVVFHVGQENYMFRLTGDMPAADGIELPPDQVFLESGPLIDEVIRFTCRHFQFSPEDAQDFGQEVRLKLIQKDYRVLRVWKRESSLRSYLAAVVLHFGRDYMDRLTGRFHSSAIAIKLGKVAIWLERLLVRDGLSYNHAKEVLRSRHGVTLSDAELDWLRDQLPPRTWPPLLEVEDDQEHVAPGSNSEEGLSSKQAGERRKAVYPILACAMKEMSARAQMFLRLRFLEGLKVAEIARAWREEQKPLYRELERIVGTLRKHLEEKGYSRTDVEDLFLGTGEDQDDDGRPEGESLWKH